MPAPTGRRYEKIGTESALKQTQTAQANQNAAQAHGLIIPNGFSLTHRLRVRHPLAGIIIISARSALNDKLKGYDTGADMYLPKPFDVEELVAAVSAFSARKQRAQTVNAGYVLYPLKKQLHTPDQQVIALTDGEVSMLVWLNSAANQQLEYWQIAQRLGLDLDQENVREILEVRMSRLRKKLQKNQSDTQAIKSVRGVGYRLCISIAVTG